MSLLWAEITITDANGRQSGADARAWVKKNLPKIADPRKKQSPVVVLKIFGEWTFNRMALDRLRSEIASKPGVTLVYSGSEFKASPRPTVAVRREVGNVVQQPVPTYRVELTLGDLEALFEPVANTGEPWKDKGVRQRLQVLGYLYTPLEHPTIEKHAQACWKYYKDVVHGAGSDSDALAKLKGEIQGNIVAAKHPGKNEVLDASVLPAADAFAVLRFPGGHGFTQHSVSQFNAGDFELGGGAQSAVPAKYQFAIGARRQQIEALVAKENPLLGAIPLVAKVTARWPSGKVDVVGDAPVLFKLEAPGDVPSDSPFAIPPLPDKVMNYDQVGMLWLVSDYPGPSLAGQLDPNEWASLRRLVMTAVKQDKSTAEKKSHTWIDEWKKPTDVPWDNVKDWWADQGTTPYTRLSSISAKDAKGALGLALVPPRPGPYKNLTLDQYAALQRLVAKAKQTGGGQDQAKTWLNAWIDGSASGAIPTDAVRPWETQPPVSFEPKIRMMIVNGLGDFFVRQKKGNVSLTDNEWDAIIQIAAKAKGAKSNPDEARALGEEWIDLWAAAPKTAFKPVPSEDALWPLREAMAPNAKERASAILNDESAALTRPATVDDAGQRKYIEELLKKVAASFPDDPQNVNAPFTIFEGKLGHTDGIKAIFDTTATRDGLHTKRGSQTTDYGTLALAALPGDTTKHPHAVTCKTNVKGLAGVVFTPSRIGGDRYRLKAYVDPDWLRTKAPGKMHGDATTGTLVTWRNVRFYRYLQLQTPRLADVSATVKKTLTYGVHAYDSTGFKKMRLDKPVATVPVYPGLGDEPTYDPIPIADVLTGAKQMYRPVATVPNSWFKQLQWGYCQVIADATAVEPIDGAIRKKAAEIAREAMEKSGLTGATVDWETLVYLDDTSPFLLNLRSFKEYNELVKAAAKVGFTVLDQNMKKESFTNTWGKAIDFAYEAIAEHLAGGGVLPGFVLIQVPRADSWDLWAVDAKTTVTSGYGTASRAAYLSHTDGVYRGVFAYPATSNATHELGHALSLIHQPPAGADCAGAHQPGLGEPFLRPDKSKDECVCVMSYSGCYGDYCGRCILTLRGWAHDHTLAVV